MPWPEDRDEVVGVNSFGVGGSNAHVSKTVTLRNIPPDIQGGSSRLRRIVRNS
jgi:hypothetical protein